MRMRTVSGVSVMALALAACGGGSDGDGGGLDPIISSGILELELPADADRPALGPTLSALVDDIEDANENGLVETPSSDLSYAGTWGAGIGDGDDEELISGTVDGDFAVAGGTMTLTFTPTTIDAPGVTIVGGSFGTGAMTVDGGSLYSGNATGTITANDSSGDQDVDVDVAIVGAITTDETFGTLDGTFTYSPTESDEVSGLFIADEQP